MLDTRNKALIIPLNKKGEIFIQDRRDYKKPDWGFFGGGIEEGESALEAVIRETNEELSLELDEKDLIFLGTIVITAKERRSERNFFLYKTNQAEFTVLEGNGGKWISSDDADNYLEVENEKFDEIKDMIEKYEI